MKKKGILSLLIGLIFLVFALVQYNDPDPWLWILMYGAIALIAILSALGFYSRWMVYLVLVVSMIWMVALFPGLWKWLRYEPVDALFYGMSPDKMYIEESREFLGLLMGTAGLLFIMKQNSRKA